MLFEKINLEKLSKKELTLLFHSLLDYYNRNNEENENHKQIENFLDRVSDQIQSIDAQIMQMKGDI
jgi:hypothetical protein